MKKRLSLTARKVLTNLLHGRPMWHGIESITPGSGIPALETSLRKSGYIDRSGNLTSSGREIAESLRAS